MEKKVITAMVVAMVVAILGSLIVAIPMSALFTFISPSVHESVDNRLGECDIYYNGKYLPCMTWGEAFKINYFIIVIVCITGFLIIYLREIIKK